MIEAVVLYSSNDSRFAAPCLRSLIQLGIKAHVITYSHMWNGTPEDAKVLSNSLSEFVDNPLILQYVIDWEHGQSPWYWEGLGRHLGTSEVSDSSEYIMYIDIDEIIDPKKFSTWIESKTYKEYDCLRLSNYWYWREPIYQALQLEDSVVMIKTEKAKQLPFQAGGRNVYFDRCQNSIRDVGSEDPMVHHYSWVRTKEEMLNKVSNWGHAGDRENWKALVEEEYSRPFNGRDFVHQYEYKVVDNIFKI